MSIVLAVLASAAVANPLAVVSEASISEQNATRLIVHSDRLGRNYEVSVQLPDAKVFLAGQKLAAIYVLDGGYELAGSNSVFLSGRAMMAPAIVVSLRLASGQPASRNNDFTHHPFTVDGKTLGGGGAAFEAFLLQDLKPFIEARYPADPASSVLFGHSLGGVFAANVFADNPDAFAGYIIGSVVVPRDPGLVDRVATATSRAHGPRVFLAVGGAEDSTVAEKRLMGQGFTALTAAFKAKPGIALQAKSYPGENHLSYYPNLMLDGFRFVLPPTVPIDLPYAALSPETLARYTGLYALPDGRSLTIKPAFNNLLSAQVDDQPAIYWLPNGTDRFYAYTADLDVTFDQQGLTLTGRGAKARAERRPNP
ncbi:alpha/beta hydrolase [Caulobacter sp. DWP3-1-3b2]|uniref:alpha/beta hydrolase n=1 Tax=Caulobacter sp. DWP3-1-3b2 TaxID=2804643 RepID=UPI003CFB9CA8